MLLTVSDYVYNDENSPYRGQISPPVRLARDAIGLKPGKLAFGMADGSAEDDLWQIVNGMGVEQANAILASRAGLNIGGRNSGPRLVADPDNMSLRMRVASFFDHGRDPTPIDGHITAPPPGVSPLENIINNEKTPWYSVAGLFSGNPQRDRWLAILKMPRGTDRAAFDTAMAATELTGAAFLKLFEGKTAQDMAQISTAYAAGFGDKHDNTLAEHAHKILSAEEFKIFETMSHGLRSDKQAAAAYICMQLRAHRTDPKALKDILTRNAGGASGNGPSWNDIVVMDHQLDARRADTDPLAAVIGEELAKDPVLTVIVRDQENPNEPAGIARRIMASNDPKEIAALLKRTTGEYFNEQELTVMNQRAAQIAGGDANQAPSALYKHVVDVCKPGSEPDLILRGVGGVPGDMPIYDQVGRLAPAAQLYFALQRGDKDAVMSVLARTSFVERGILESTYPAIADQLAKANIAPPGGTLDPRAAIAIAKDAHGKPLLNKDEREVAQQFLTGMNVTSLDAANATGAQLAQRVTDDLASRWPWILGQFDHEREPLRERLMQFQVTLGQVLTDVQSASPSYGSTHRPHRAGTDTSRRSGWPAHESTARLRRRAPATRGVDPERRDYRGNVYRFDRYRGRHRRRRRGSERGALVGGYWSHRNCRSRRRDCWCRHGATARRNTPRLCVRRFERRSVRWLRRSGCRGR